MMRWTMGGLALLALSGCPGFGDKTLAELEGISDDVTYHADIRPILEARCFPCHTDPPKFGAPNPIANYDQAFGTSQRILVRAVQEGTMPPGGGVTGEEKALIEAWVSAGAPEGDPAAGPDMAIEPDMAEPDAGPDDLGVDMDPSVDMAPPAPPTWDDDVRPVMDMSCAFPGCHGGGMPSSNLDLTTYAGFIAGGFGGDLTGEGDPARSGFVDRLRARDGLPLMPQGGPSLDEDIIVMIETWIAAGFPEN